MSTLQFQHYGETRDANATDGEIAIFEKICEIIHAAGYDNKIALVRKSDNYVTVGIWSDPYDSYLDIARIKYTQRAKWIVLPLYGTAKTKIETAEDIEPLRDGIIENFQFCLKDI